MGDVERSAELRGNCALALGLLGAMGDVEALPALVRSAEDGEDIMAFARGLAIVAIGRICAREGVPELTTLTSAFPHRVDVAAFREVSSVF